jgi:DNA-binding MarR family transcriptional regulator
MEEHGAQATISRDDADRATAVALDTVVARLSSALRRALTELEDKERLTMPQLRCLQALAVTGTALTTQLARKMEVAVPTMTGRIDGLVARGFVERHPDSEDRRQIQLVLTDAGRAHLARCQEATLNRLYAVLAQLQPDQKERLATVVHELAAVLNRQGTPKEAQTYLEE